ncbi:FecR family protein [Daejeonella sp.]|uniref:FecR family protein n=1 Tax=Daejeonella sp. TaxID=2805397 RepID=UPI0039839DFE
MSIHRFKYLFHQFVNKTASQEEAEEFLVMMKKDGYNKELQLLLDEFWNEPYSNKALYEERAETIFNKIMTSSQIIKPATIKSRGKGIWLKAAAAVLIFALSALFYTKEFRTSNPQLKVNNTKLVKPDKPSRRFINLPDGSSVILNENSKIEFGEKFLVNGVREVYLEGEAYFDIIHDSSHPFIVRTGKLQTTVLGTAFNINANSVTGTVIVTVTRGKVKVGDRTRTFMVILPDEQVVFNRDLSRHFKKPVDAGTITAWKNEDIYFDDVSVSDVANQLEERFNVSIVFANEIIKNCRFSATFLKSQSLQQILNVIGEFNHIKYQLKDNKTVVLDGAGCN